jgi:glycosyltransferase involved in cell wall biosynthesis
MEPFGLVFLEAMAVGLPVVAYYSGSVPEIIVDGVTGLISAPEQPATMVNNLVNLLSNRSLATQMGAAGKHRAAAVFSSASIVPRWADILRSFVVKIPARVTVR